MGGLRFFDCKNIFMLKMNKRYDISNKDIYKSLETFLRRHGIRCNVYSAQYYFGEGKGFETIHYINIISDQKANQLSKIIGKAFSGRTLNKRFKNRTFLSSLQPIAEEKPMEEDLDKLIAFLS